MNKIQVWRAKGSFARFLLLGIYVSSAIAAITYDYTSSGKDWTGICSTGQL